MCIAEPSGPNFLFPSDELFIDITRYISKLGGTDGEEPVISSLHPRPHYLGRQRTRLMYYLGAQLLANLAEMPDESWTDFGEIVTYNSQELGTKEAKDSLFI